MAEAVSFGIAIASLAGIFLDCVDCFELILIGRDFKDDFGYSLTRLSAAQLRLTRWGVSVGLVEYINEVGTTTKPLDLKSHLSQVVYSDEEIGQAKEWLEDIIARFKIAQKDSIRYAKGQKSEDLGTFNDTTDLERVDDSAKRLFIKIGQIVKSRKAKLGRAALKTKWALHGKKHFEELITKISEIVKDLVELFPATTELQQQICKTEVGQLDVEDLPALIAVAGEDDEILGEVAEAAGKDAVEQDPSVGLRFSDITINGNARHFSGQLLGAGEKGVGVHWGKIIAGEHSVSVMANISDGYKGRIPFEDVKKTD
ncbi:Prion-inhibition and propagation domain containing protein [Hyaloscypha variabilis]